MTARGVSAILVTVAFAIGLFGGSVAGRRYGDYCGYVRGYRAAVDSVRVATAPPETVSVILRRGERVTVWRQYGSQWIGTETTP